jgi:hypothetical protein
MELLAQYENREFQLKNTIEVRNQYTSESKDNLWKKWMFVKTSDKEEVHLIGFREANNKKFRLTPDQPKGLITDDYGNRGMAILARDTDNNTFVVFKIFVDKRPILIDMAMEGTSNVVRFTVDQ